MSRFASKHFHAIRHTALHNTCRIEMHDGMTDYLPTRNVIYPMEMTKIISIPGSLSIFVSHATVILPTKYP